jgi:2-dehydropantoate 2-reductase
LKRVRIIVLGAGGIGGVIGGRLLQHGHQVVLIARGEHLRTIQTTGLRLEDPDETITLRIAAAGSPSDISFQPDDVVVLATKTQDASAALLQLREVAPSTIPVVCATNGVESERLSARLFHNTYAMNVMMPTAFLEPGVVQVISAPIGGALDVGRFPSGVDDVTAELAGMLNRSQFVSHARSDIMRAKYRKLIMNCSNAVEAACGQRGDASAELMRRISNEAETVLLAANIDVATEDEEAPKRNLMVYRPIHGMHRGGGSTWQSLVTGRSVETDYLNGEIVLLGAIHGVPTPVNSLLQRTMRTMATERQDPQSVDAAALLGTLADS